jgi:hypothetical protein
MQVPAQLNHPFTVCMISTSASESSLLFPLLRLDEETLCFRYSAHACTANQMDRACVSSPEPPIVRNGNGLLVKCFDDYVEGFPIQDKLREMLLSEESENFELYSDQDKGQLLYRLLEHLVRKLTN